MGRPGTLPSPRADRSSPGSHLAERHADASSPVSSRDPFDHEQAARQPRRYSLVASTPDGLPEDSVALAFQLRAIPKSALQTKVRNLSEDELAELELATDEALGRMEPEQASG